MMKKGLLTIVLFLCSVSAHAKAPLGKDMMIPWNAVKMWPLRHKLFLAVTRLP